MGGKQSKKSLEEHSFVYENPLTHLETTEDLAAAIDEIGEIIEILQSDLESPFRGVTSDYNIEKNERAWMQNIDELRKSDNVLDKAMLTEYDRVVEESSKMFKKRVYMDSPCKELEALVTKCYKDNPNDILKCAETIRDFQKCVYNIKPEENFVQCEN